MAKTILLADDSLTIQKVVELTFMGQDYRVVSVGDGRSALARWSESPVDLVIADVHMPGVEGYDVCHAIKAQNPRTPVLLLVGTFEPFDEARAATCGSDGHLKKPFDSQELLRLVDQLLAQPVAQPSAPAAPAVPNPRHEAQANVVPLAAPPGSIEAVGKESSSHSGPVSLSEGDIERVAKRVVELLSEQAVREIAWEVVPDLAEVAIKERIRELEAQVE